MALSRKFLSALGIEADKVDEIIEAHTTTVNALKEERDKYKTDAEKLPDVQRELDDLKAQPVDDYKDKYDALKQEYDDYKADVDAKSVKAQKTEAYRKLLKDAKVSEKRIDSVLRVSDIEKIELDKDGNIKGADALKKNIETEWADFIVTEEAKGANTATPPEGGGNTPPPVSRAAQLAAKYRQNLYGVEPPKGDAK